MSKLFTVLLSYLLILHLICSLPSFAAAGEDMITAPPGTSPEVLKKFNEGFALINSEKFLPAIDIYADICKSAPEFAEAHMMYGVALMKLSKCAEAETALTKALSLKPDLPLGLIDLASVYQMQGRYKEALAKFNRYLQLYPKGKYAGTVTGLVNALKTEQQRNQGATSSRGQDNYFSEAIALGAVHWLPAAMPIKIYLAPGTGIKEYRDEYAGIIKQSFADWGAASQGKVSFDYVNSPDDASIICTWVDDPKQVINPAEGGQALVAPSTSGVMGRTKIKILTQNPGVASKVTEASVRHICLHEIGHALGILGHSSQPGDIMFTTVNFSSPLAGLSERDKKTIFAIYTAPDSVFEEHKIRSDEGAMVGSDTNPTNRALRLNSEGLKEIKAGHYQEALKKFEEAISLDPDSDFIRVNIANCCSESGKNDFNSGNYARSEKSMLMAAENFQKSGKKDAAAEAYKNLALIARAQGHAADERKYHDKAESLKK